MSRLFSLWNVAIGSSILVIWNDQVTSTLNFKQILFSPKKNLTQNLSHTMFVPHPFFIIINFQNRDN